MCKKVIALLLALTMALGCGSALAENTKHERVFAVTAYRQGRYCRCYCCHQ